MFILFLLVIAVVVILAVPDTHIGRVAAVFIGARVGATAPAARRASDPGRQPALAQPGSQRL